MTIAQTGFQKPSRDIIKLAQTQGDNSFGAWVDVKGMLPEPPRGWQYEHITAIALKLSGPVRPHTDEWGGLGNPDPDDRLAFFWIVKSSDRGWLQVGREVAHLDPGDYVFFHDDEMHSLIIERQWLAIAVQLRRSNIA